MTKNTRWQPILLTTLALATIPAALFYTDYAISNLPEPEKQEARVNVPRVSTLTIGASSHQSEMHAFGEVQAQDEISLSSQIEGRIIWRNPAFVVGGRLQNGDTLIRVDATDFRVALAEAKQALAEAALALQEEEHQQYQAKLDWQRSGIKDSPSDLLLRKPQVKVARTRYQAAQAAVKKAQRDLDQTQLKAPFDAVVVERFVGSGSFLSRGGAVATLRNSATAEVQLALSADQWQLLQSNAIGSEVELSTLAYPDVIWPGKVQRLSEIIASDTRLRTLVVAVKQPLDHSQPLLYGTFVSARIPGQKISDLFAIPASALTADGYIWHVVDNQLQRIKRSPVFSAEGQVFIERGELPDQIQLVRKPMISYLNGMQVKPVTDGVH